MARVVIETSTVRVDRDLATLCVGDDGNSDHAVVEAILSAVRGFDRMSVDGAERGELRGRVEQQLAAQLFQKWGPSY